MPILLYGIVFYKFIQQIGGGHYHTHAGALGVVLGRSGGRIGIGGWVIQQLPADDAAVYLPEFTCQILDPGIKLFLFH